MSSFSERMGYKPIKTKIQIESMDDELKNRLWNTFNDFYLENFSVNSYTGNISLGDRTFITKLWTDFLKIRIEGYEYSKIYRYIQKYFFNCEWHQVFSFIEFFANNYDDKSENREFIKRCNSILEREVSVYRFVSGKITQITSKVEITEIEEALHTPLKYVNAHINRALELLSDRKAPDFRNSIKESISAVESICNLITGDKKSLGKCLDKIEKEKKIPIHGALKEAFDHLYGYTSSEEGIRHASLKESEIDFDIAKFMLVSCSAFINYLISKASKVGIEL